MRGRAGLPTVGRMTNRILPYPWPCCLVTGATSGIGLHLVRQLAEAGVEVVALGRDVARLEALAARSAYLSVVQADLLDLDAIPALAARLVATHPRLAGVVLNAGVQHDVRFDADGYGPRQVRDEVAVNLTAPMLLAQALLPHLAAQPHATIACMTSVLAQSPKPRAAVYSATKAGLARFADALRLQLEPGPVRVVELVVPLVDTPMTAGRPGAKLPPEAAAAAILSGLRSGRPVVRVGKARAAAWLHRFAPWILARVMRAS